MTDDMCDEDDVCGGVIPDEMCGNCPDCRDYADARRETCEEDA